MQNLTFTDASPFTRRWAGNSEIPTDVTDNLNPGTDGRAARRERDDRLSPQDWPAALRQSLS